MLPRSGLSNNIYGSLSAAMPAPAAEQANEGDMETSALRGPGRRLLGSAARDSKLRILVTDGRYKHTLSIVRSLGARRHEVTVLAGSRDDLAACSRYCSEIAYTSGQGSNDIASAVLRILERKQHDVVIPVSYAATRALARVKQPLLSFARIEVAEFDQICLAADKERVRELAARLGIPTPMTLYPDSREAVESCVDRLGYPIIVKPRQESAGITVRAVKERSMLYPAFDSFLAVTDHSAPPPMLQEFIPGYGCGFFALYQRGVCKRIFMHRRIRENPPTGGISCCAESFYDPKLKELSLRLLDALQWHGVAMVEFRRDKRDGEYKLLEINPKFWGSLDLALAAGADFPGDLCRMAAGEELTYTEEYRRNLRFHWLFSGDLQHAVSNPASISAILLDSLNPLVKSNFWLNDLRPTLTEIRSVLHSGWRRLRESNQ